MRENAILLGKGLVGAIRRTLYCSPHPINPFGLNFCTLIPLSPAADLTDECCDSEKLEKAGGTEEPQSLCSRIEKLKIGESVASAFQSWMGDGFPIHSGDVFHTINRLRKFKANKRALEVF